MNDAQQKPVINQEIIALYDEYTHAPLPRRVFMKRLTAITGSTAAASTVLPFLENNYANAQTVPVADPRLVSEKVTYPAEGGSVTGYLTYPKAATGKLPSVVVIHENRGLNPHTEDVARRLALAGYIVLAPDFLSLAGGTPSDEDKARDMISKLDAKVSLGTGLASIKYLEGHTKGNGKVGAVGFCWGGGMVNQLAVNSPELDAAVAFYGRQPKAEEVTKIKAPLLLHYAGLDEGINGGIPAYEQALKAAGKPYTIHIYDGVNHAFFNDTNAARYNEAAAKLALQRTLDFFNKYLA